ncbi:zinc finger protein 497-like [Conger conger]|uniref:zinc finger protein 497-like n=1 Tax=Conger conger TaxID=82655 RepID=UPI002A5A22F0|nr:zinc finger protein 497-like [Conger conger]XP_061081268.1 zinc finger protein 497-like [Conger conger]
MDPDIIKMEEVAVEEETTAPPTELAPDGPADSYTTIIIQEPPATSIVQPYQHENLQCFQCFITFCNSKAKERHMKKSHREEYKQQLQQCDTLFTCYVCDRTFPSSELLTQHQASHNKEDKPFKCPHCQESFRTFSELTSHRRQVCPERQFVCKDCGETFRGPALLRSHRLTQHAPRPGQEQEAGDDLAKTHRCGKCGKGFEAEAQLLQHQENHAGDRHCNGSAPAKRRGRPPKSEEVAGAGAAAAVAADGEKKGKRRKKGEGEEAEESGVKNHADPDGPAEEKVKAKRGRPAKAPQEPQAPQGPGQDRPAEEERKPPARQHPCPDCQLSFPAAAQLRAHKKEKHSRPPPPPPARKAHPCGECEESFARPLQLQAHTARAHCAGRHACPTCGKSFGRESNLKAHLQTHAEEEEEAPAAKR